MAEVCSALVVACGDSTVEKVIHKCGSELGQESIHRKKTCNRVWAPWVLYIEHLEPAMKNRAWELGTV